MIEWVVSSKEEVNDLLSRSHYLGPLKSGGSVLILAGKISGLGVVAAQVWKKPTARNLPNDGSWLELSRWCLTPEAGENAGSRQHKQAVLLLKQDPRVTTLVSYSDPVHGHTGSLYRACNWRWYPTWHRLRTPPTGNGSWKDGDPQSVKDRWVFAVRKDEDRDRRPYISDSGAIRYWRKNATGEELRWASPHPQLGLL